MEWYPPADLSQRFDHVYPSTYTDLGEPKGLFHTTEGSGWPGYNGGGSAPHFTYHPSLRQFRQHFPLSMPSRSLRNLPGDDSPNRDRVIQIELVGTCTNGPGLFWPEAPEHNLDDVAGWMRWVEANFGVPRSCTVGWLSYPASFGNSPVRMSWAAFDNYAGWLGHQHAAENDHGDPGDFTRNIAYLLGDDMTAEEHAQLWAVRSDLGAANTRIVQAHDMLAALGAKVDALAAKVDAIATPTVRIEGEFRPAAEEA